jgi:non-ribosomal peptide synthetase component F
MILGILGILKSGGAYLPLDPLLPQERLDFIMAETGTELLLRCQGMTVDLPPVGAAAGSMPPMPIPEPSDLLYVIYTSGSTGQPKGAAVDQGNFMNLLHWFMGEFCLSPGDGNLVVTSPSFDLTQKNLVASLLTGGVLTLPGSQHFDPAGLLGEIGRGRVTWLNCTPGIFYKLVEAEAESGRWTLSSLRCIFLGGEPISMAVVLDWLERTGSAAEIVNTYGPTETADVCAYYRIDRPGAFREREAPAQHRSLDCGWA